jgi:uncharacterized membrane protein
MNLGTIILITAASLVAIALMIGECTTRITVKLDEIANLLRNKEKE